MIYFLTTLAMLPNTYCMAAFVPMTVPLKHRWLYPVAVTVMGTLLWICNHVLRTTVSALLELSIYAVIFLLLHLFSYPGQRLKTFLVQVLLMATQMVITFTTLLVIIPVAKHMGINPDRLVFPEDLLYPAVCLLCSIFCCIGMYICSRLIKKLVLTMNESRNLVWFITVPISQLVLVNQLLRYSLQAASNSGYQKFPFNVVLAVLLSIGADIACILIYRRFYRMALMQVSIEQAEQHLNAQNSYYRELQNSILSVNQIRHDLKNQLQAAYYLLEQGQTEQVHAQLDLIRDNLQERIGTKYCQNLMVDAVLCEKARICKEQSVNLQLSVFLPAELTIENAHLCSIFSNLLDNSIEAVLELGAGTISLRTDLHGNQLMICCQNPSLPPRTQKQNQDLLRRHGLGLEILKKLAAVYNGYLDSRFKNGVFTTTITLQLPKE